jgi:hypothetical protein
MDRLAAQGMRFTDAHSSSGVCSSSRYALWWVWMNEQLAQEEWGQDVPTTDWDKMSQPRLRGMFLGRQ